MVLDKVIDLCYINSGIRRGVTTTVFTLVDGIAWFHFYFCQVKLVIIPNVFRNVQLRDADAVSRFYRTIQMVYKGCGLIHFVILKRVVSQHIISNIFTKFQ